MRLVTLNLFNPDVNSASDTAEFLDGTGADIIGLTECRLDAARAIADKLGTRQLCHAHAPFFGNALILRRGTIVSGQAVTLPPSRLGETRSAALVHANTPLGPVSLIATHLDDQREADRIEQVEALAKTPGVQLSHSVLLGDLNSLTGSDYDSARWERIETERKRAGLEDPKTRLTEQLRDRHSLLDACVARHPHQPLGPTCRYGTRVDYILIGTDSGLSPAKGTYRILEAMDHGLTDHNAVRVDLEADT